MTNRPKTKILYDRMCDVIPGGVNSPVRSGKDVDQMPMIVESGAKDQVVDIDGHSYIDYCGSWGALIHGHAHPTIVDAVQKRIARGTSFGITSAIEETLASKVVQIMKNIEKVRFVSSGTEATMSALRLARGYTQRDIIVKFYGNYHGHADFLMVQAGSGLFGISPTSTSAGIPADLVKHTVCLPYNGLATCRKYLQENGEKVAAVIIEPVAGNMGVVPATQEFISMLREETKNKGALLILDEVITGFRVGLKGAQEMFNVKPDLTCLGKIIGGGFPAAAFGGRKEIMNHLSPLGPVYQAGTLSGNPVAMEAGLQSVLMAEKPGFYEELERKTEIITEPVKEAFKQGKIKGCVQQVGSMFTIFFGKERIANMEDGKGLDLAAFTRFFQYMFANGVYIPPSQYEAWFVSIVHSDENLKKTRDIILKFLT